MDAGGDGCCGIQLGDPGLGLGVALHRDHDLIVADPQDIAVLQPVATRAELRDRLRHIIDEHPIGAEVFEAEVAVAKIDAGVVRGYVAQRVRQHPIVVARAPDRAAAHAEKDGMALGELPPVIADDAQAKRHGAPKSSGILQRKSEPIARTRQLPRHARQYNVGPN